MPIRFQIAQYPFVSMSAFPIGETTSVEIETRPGVDGVYGWNLGKHGKPFDVETFADVADVQFAGLLMTQYEALIGQVVPVMFAGLFLPKQYLILNVVPQPEGIRQVLAGVGGLSYPNASAGIVQASWSLVATHEDLQTGGG